jgi:hypothetical protein
LIDGFGGMASIVRSPRLDFDEHDRLPIHGDEIDLTDPISLAMCDNDIAQAFQEPYRGLLASHT